MFLSSFNIKPWRISLRKGTPLWMIDKPLAPLSHSPVRHCHRILSLERSLPSPSPASWFVLSAGQMSRHKKQDKASIIIVCAWTKKLRRDKYKWISKTNIVGNKIRAELRTFFTRRISFLIILRADGESQVDVWLYYAESLHPSFLRKVILPSCKHFSAA